MTISVKYNIDVYFISILYCTVYVLDVRFVSSAERRILPQKFGS